MTASITCPRCGRTSWNPNDVREGYCGACHDWTNDVARRRATREDRNLMRTLENALTDLDTAVETYLQASTDMGLQRAAAAVAAAAAVTGARAGQREVSA